MKLLSSKKLKILKVALVICFMFQIGGLLFSASPVEAALVDPNPIDFQPQVGIPDSEFVAGVKVKSGNYDKASGETTSNLLAKYVKAFYNYAVAVVGILAAIVLMAGGVLWLTSAGNDTRIAQAKELIIGSVVGTAILLGAWLVLNTINPDLVELKGINVDMFEKASLETVCCEQGRQTAMLPIKDCKAMSGATPFLNTENSVYVVLNERCEEVKLACLIGTQCDGTIACSNVEYGMELPSDSKITCNGFKKDYYKINRSGGCGSIAECKDSTYSCAGVTNGDVCKKPNDKIELTGYCYDNICYPHPGQEYEPCGIKEGAYCLPSSISCNRLSSNRQDQGRKCESGLYCCY